MTAIVLAAASFMVGLDSTILVTAMPRMASDFAVPPTLLASSITVYVLVATMLMPASSWIAQRLGAKWIFMAAMVGFALASIGCGLSTSLPQFLLMRALQAAAGSLMVPVGNLVLLSITPKRILVSVMAIQSTPALIAPVIGPPVGGFITSYFDWAWAFYINAPIALIGVLAASRLIPHMAPERETPFDLPGFLLSAGTMCALIVGLDRLAARGGDWRPAVVLLVAGVALGMLAVRHARRSLSPMVPMEPLRHPCFRAATLGAGTFVRLPFFAQGFVIPLMLQIGLGLSAFQAGLLLLAQNGGDLVLKPVAGRILRLLGFRTALVSGAILQALSFAACAMLTPAIPLAGLFAILFLVGMARSVLFTALMALRFADVPSGELGGATVLGNLANSLTQASAISLAALLLNLLGGSAHAPDLGAFHAAMFALAGLGLLAAPLFARLHPDAGAEVSGKVRRGLSEVREEPS